MSMVAERYAKALLDLAVANSDVKKYQEELEAVTKTYQGDNGLRVFLLAPQNHLMAKKTVLIRLFRGKVEKNILRFLLLLMEKGRAAFLPEIYRVYVRMADEYRNILNITITSAFPLGENQINEIGRTFEAVCHKSSAKITVKTDASLIGGIKVSVGDRVYDGTVKGKLSKIQSAITEKS